MTRNELFSVAIPNFFKNLRSLFKYNLEKDAVKQDYLHKEISDLHEKLAQAWKEIIEIYFLQNKDEAQKYKAEIEYIKKVNTISAFPYEQIKTCNIPKYGFDKKVKLPFVIHNNKHLYFPANWTPESACKTYCNYIERENLLGGGYTEKAPHQYITENFHVENGDIVLDVGCAEALFALDSIEKAKYVYLFEADEKWIQPLKATFAPYQDKVKIIQKFVSGKDSENTITLNTILGKYSSESFFIKMDIEGAEEEVIRSSTDFLMSNNIIKLACCTYHRANHSKEISKVLQEKCFDIEFSEGFMLFYLDSHQQPPYFRKGLIRARKTI